MLQDALALLKPQINATEEIYLGLAASLSRLVWREPFQGSGRLVQFGHQQLLPLVHGVSLVAKADQFAL